MTVTLPDPRRADSRSRLLQELGASSVAGGRIVHEAVLPSQEADYADWPRRLHPALVQAMDGVGVTRPYSHQAQAVDAVLDGQDVVVVTPTASGKSLCYTLPTLDAWLKDPEARALWLFPTKALAQDQLASLQEIARHLPPGLRAERRLWFWNPPLVEGTLGVRRSALLEARRLCSELLRRDLQTIAFTRSRSSVELLLSYLRRVQPAGRPGDPGPVRGYRSGYLPLERRAIEAGLRDGSVRAVVSTNALELGVDIGGLDASVLVGYPGTVAAAWQQLGRAGRRDLPSLGVLIASDSPVDQFIVRHPEYLLERAPEEALINPDNLLVLGGHVQAAAFELPFEVEERLGGAEVGPLLECFAEDGLVHRSGSRYHWAADAFPAEALSLRSACATNVVIVDTSTVPGGPGQGPQGPWSASGGGRPGSHGRVIGEVDQFAAPVLVHDDAVYIHEGAQYHVERLDWEEKRAYVHPVSVDHYTMAETGLSVTVLERYAGPEGRHCRWSWGEVRVTRVATIYKKLRFLTHETIGAGPIALPEQDLHTTATWLTFDAAAVASLSRAELDAGLAGLARALQHAASLLCMCDPRDIGRHAEVRGRGSPGATGDAPAALAAPPASEPEEFAEGRRPAPGVPAAPPPAGLPTLYLYDSVAGGVGLAERCHDRHRALLGAASGILEGCACATGCPSCVGPGDDGVDARAAAKHLLLAALADAG